MENKEIPEVTTIRCQPELKKKLCKLDVAEKGITYEQIINILIDYYNKKNESN